MPPSCDKYNAIATDYLANELDNTLRSDFEAHLRRCAECSRILSGMRAMFATLEKELSASLSSPELSADRLDRLREAADAHYSRTSASIIPFTGAARKVEAASPGRATLPATAARWTGLAASLLVAAYISVQMLGGVGLEVVVPSQVSSVPALNQSSDEVVPEPTLQEELETYGLIMPFARNMDAERESLARLSYEYPPAYGLGGLPDSIETSVPYLGIDGPTPFFDILREDNSRQL